MPAPIAAPMIIPRPNMLTDRASATLRYGLPAARVTGCAAGGSDPLRGVADGGVWIVILLMVRYLLTVAGLQYPCEGTG
jgi:hypothetical protein